MGNFVHLKSDFRSLCIVALKQEPIFYDSFNRYIVLYIYVYIYLYNVYDACLYCVTREKTGLNVIKTSQVLIKKTFTREKKNNTKAIKNIITRAVHRDDISYNGSHGTMCSPSLFFYRVINDFKPSEVVRDRKSSPILLGKVC